MIIIDVSALIPFGWKDCSGELVDVASVQRGGRCGCICPSCKTPLIARQGIKKEWHFAHQSRNVHEKTKAKCEYSFAVSIRLMIRQLAVNGFTFLTPKLVDSVCDFSDISHEYKSIDFVVTEGSLLHFDWMEVGVIFSGVEVDVVGLVERVPFVIYVTYQGREVPMELCTPDMDRSAIMEVNLDGLRTLFAQEKSGKYIEVLRNHIEKGLDGKSWVYHPRTLTAKAKAKAKIDEWILKQKPKVAETISSSTHSTRSQYNETSRSPDKTTNKRLLVPKKEARDFKCLECKAQWRGTSRHCNACRTHLYATEFF